MNLAFAVAYIKQKYQFDVIDIEPCCINIEPDEWLPKEGYESSFYFGQINASAGSDVGGSDGSHVSLRFIDDDNDEGFGVVVVVCPLSANQENGVSSPLYYINPSCLLKSYTVNESSCDVVFQGYRINCKNKVEE